ncbi:hypothetical protein JRY29_12835 [Salmonella enterica subsp. enterica serovar Kentucky]|nr:hypothetical protein JRY29_12835 [Salmonella enterica subsp. enterica serovar Kentucky]
MPLSLPHRWRGIQLSTLAQLQLWPSEDMAQLPPPAHYYSERFCRPAEQARLQDEKHRIIKQAVAVGYFLLYPRRTVLCSDNW